MKQCLFHWIALGLTAPLLMAAGTPSGGTHGSEAKKVVVGKECGNPETLLRVQKSIKSLQGRAANWALVVDDKGEGYCGYNMILGKKVKKLAGDTSEEALISEISAFFGAKK